jgi:uncharacterized protein YndB with AHSA1/START domain
MAGRFEATVLIERPIEEVFAFLANGENDPKFSPRVLEIAKTTDGPPGVGTVYASTVKDAGVKTQREFELTEFEPPTRIRWREVSKNLVTAPEGGYDLAPEGGGRSTVARSLARSAPAPARVVYGGYPYPMRHVPRPLHRPASFWWRALRVRWLRASGHLVIMDRYVFDGWMDRNGPSPRGRRWTRRLLEWPFPKPDLVVVVGVPGEEPRRPSGEHDSATPEERHEHPSLRRHVPGVVVVDATRPQKEVLEAVTGYLWREDRRVGARQRWTG